MEQIERIMQQGLERRGMGEVGVATQGNLKCAIDILDSADSVAIITGFPIKGTGRGETDGITGSLALAETLSVSCKSVVLISDAVNRPLLLAGLAPSMPIPVLSQRDFAAREWMCGRRVMVFVERPGKAQDGSCYSMRGECLDEEMEDFDQLLLYAKRSGLKTLAIGDGGNELGLGAYRELIGKNVVLGEKIAAREAADLVLVAGTSNWGAHGICAGLKAMRNPEAEMEREMERLKKIVEAGAVDGATKRSEATVDGYSGEDYITQIGRIYGK